MSLTIQFPFITPSNYTFDTNKIEVTGGLALLKLIDDAKQFIQAYTSDAGFTYDSAKAEFTGGKVQQIDQHPANSTFGANYNSNIDGNWGGGVLTGTPIGGAAESGGKLDLAHSDTRYVDYDADLNADSQQTGTLKFKVTPNYTGNPANDMYFFTVTKEASSNFNEISLYHRNTGTISLRIFDNLGIFVGGSNFVSWSPTNGVEYEFEFDYDLTVGANRFFIDGIQQGATSVLTTTRDSNIGLLRIGSNFDASVASNFKIDDLIIFSTVQHTADYTPGYTVTDYVYLTSKVDLPQFVYSGLGAIQSFDGMTATEAGSPRYIVNGEYWTGLAWAASDNSYAQSSPASDINTNLPTLTAADTLDISIVFPDSNTTMSDVDNTIVDYAGQILPTDNPTIEVNTYFLTDALEGFAETSLIPTNDNIKYIIKKDNSWYWFNGVGWAISNKTYAESNTAAEIETNKATFTTTGIVFKLLAFLHSDNGTTTPELDLITILYSFEGTQEIIEYCTVWADNNNNSGDDSTPFSAELMQDVVKYKTGTIIRKETIPVTPDVNGVWEVELIETDNMDPLTKYRFTFNGFSYVGFVPNQPSINFWDLPGLRRI